MPRYLLTPVFWRSGEGRMVRVYELVDRWEVCHTVVFGYHPSGSRQALGAYLAEVGIDPADVLVLPARLVTRAEGEALQGRAR